MALGGGRVLVAEPDNHALRLVDLASGACVTVVGFEGQGFRDGATEFASERDKGRRRGPRGGVARLNKPEGLWVCRDGSVLVADTGNHAVRRLSADLTRLETVAGNARAGTADGPRGQFCFPASVCEVELKDVAIKPAPWRVFKGKPFEMKCDRVRGTTSGSIAPASCL